MKIKALITFILMFALCIPFMALASTATENEVDDQYSPELIYSAFKSDKITETELNSQEDWMALKAYNTDLSTWETPEMFMLDCKLTTYYRATDAEIPVGAILYAVGYGAERIGTESDVDIVEDFLEDGYIVIVTEFLNSAAAVYPAIDGAASILKYEVSDKDGFVGKYYHKYLKYDTFVVPAGYRLLRNITYFDLTVSGAQGTYESVVESWNKAGTEPVVTEKGITYKKVKTIDQIIMPNGKPITDVESGNKKEFFEYKLDIIYPSIPKDGYEAPVWAMGSSSFERSQGGTSGHPERMHSIGALFRGYVGVVYDHEYMPHMHGRYSYGHIENVGYAQSPYNGAKTHSAAMRCIRYYADKLGFSKDKIGVMGHSKSSMVGVLSSPNPQLLPEHKVYEGYQQGQTFGVQPYLTYDDGTPIPSGANCVYHSMGYGSINRAKYLTPSNVPTFIACGVLDNATPAPRDYWEQEFKDYSKAVIPFGAAYMPEVGHTLPYYLADPIYGYVYYNAVCAFFDYYLNGAAPEVMYTGIESDGTVDADDKGLFIYFSAPITEWSFLENISVTDKNGKEVNGTWIADCGSTRWIFDTDCLIVGAQYTLTLDDGAADINNSTVKEGLTKTFTVK